MSENKYEEFVRLLARHQRRLHAYTFSLLPNPSDADDVLQETHIVLWRKFAEFNPGSDFGAWACKVAYWEVMAYRKRCERSRLIFDDDVLESIAIAVDKYGAEIDSRRDALNKCLHKLKDRDRDLVLRRYRYGASTECVANEVGRSVSAVYKALNRIYDALLVCIRRQLAEGG